jgi:hypothetical protein
MGRLFCLPPNYSVKYHFNARWYDAETARFISEDPARDGVSWFAYVGNNPLKYVDPTGLRQVQEAITEGEEDEVNIDGLRYIIDKRLSAAIDLANSISQDHSVSSKFQFNNENLPKLFSMIGIYNRRIVPDSIDDYLKDGRISEDFDASQTYLTGDYQTSAHYGIDGVPDEEIPEASGDFHSPWYTILDSTNTGGSNPFVLQVIGTDIRIRVKHADKEDLPSFNRIYRPNETIVVFPERNNSNLPSSSTARHIHFETTRGGEHAWQRYLGPPEKTLCCHFTIPQSPGEMRLRSFSPNNHGQDENAKKILPNLFQVHHQHDNRNLRFTGLCQLGH